MLQILLILIGGCQLSNAASLICYKGTINNYQRTNLNNAETLIEFSCINVSLPTFFYTFGFMAEVNDTETTNVMIACVKNSIVRNCILLDWEDEASSSDSVLHTGLIPASYASKALPNSILIGQKMGKVLIKMTTYGLNLKSVILVGHSLGAHLWGNAGREVRMDGKDIAMIVGLDPAGPLYDSIIAQPLNSASAKFVYCVHTDPGRYGTSSSYCTVDIWANFNHFLPFGDHHQPGCMDGTYHICNHMRAIYLFVYSMSVNKTSLKASKADNYYAWAALNTSSTETIYIGDLVNTQATPGNYYLTTNPPPNFGKGKAGLRP